METLRAFYTSTKESNVPLSYTVGVESKGPAQGSIAPVTSGKLHRVCKNIYRKFDSMNMERNSHLQGENNTISPVGYSARLPSAPSICSAWKRLSIRSCVSRQKIL